MQVIDITTDQIAIKNLTVADNLWSRFLGLMGRKRFERGYGMLLKPCTSVHTMFMRVPIDIYFLDESNVIVDRRLQVSPWRIAIPKTKCCAVLEVPIPIKDLAIGSQLSIQD